MTTNKPGSFEPLVGLARNAKRVRMEMQCDPQWVLTLAEERDQLRAECEKLRKDAARYQWLRAHFGRFSESYDGGCDRVTKMVVNPDGWDVDPDSLDAAIDAAIQGDNP